MPPGHRCSPLHVLRVRNLKHLRVPWPGLSWCGVYPHYKHLRCTSCACRGSGASSGERPAGARDPNGDRLASCSRQVHVPRIAASCGKKHGGAAPQLEPRPIAALAGFGCIVTNERGIRATCTAHQTRFVCDGAVAAAAQCRTTPAEGCASRTLDRATQGMRLRDPCAWHHECALGLDLDTTQGFPELRGQTRTFPRRWLSCSLCRIMLGRC